MRNDGIAEIPWPGWQVVRELGEGGYGKVYEIERTQSGITERAALKVIRIPKNQSEYEADLGCNSEEEIKEWYKIRRDKAVKEILKMKEFKGLSNVVSLEDWAIKTSEKGCGYEIYIKMELLTPLKQVLHAGYVSSEKEIVKLGVDICNSLVVFEKKEVIHGDIKPSNILVSPLGNFKIGDFGDLSRTIISRGLFGNAKNGPYMSPEMIRGDIDKTADTYSLGLVMYELLNAGRPPFIKATDFYSESAYHEAYRKRIEGNQLPFPKNGSEVLKRIVLKACSYNINDRYESAENMRNDLFLEYQSINNTDKNTASYDNVDLILLPDSTRMPDNTVFHTGEYDWPDEYS